MAQMVRVGQRAAFEGALQEYVAVPAVGWAVGAVAAELAGPIGVGVGVGVAIVCYGQFIRAHAAPLNQTLRAPPPKNLRKHHRHPTMHDIGLEHFMRTVRQIR